MQSTLQQPTEQIETTQSEASPFRPYIKPFSIAGHALRFFFATPEAQAWYDPIKPHTRLEYEWIVKNLDLTNETVVDVGTHHGHYALVLAAMKPKKLICVDAVESNCAIAEANLALNGFNPSIRHCAITTKNDKVQFTADSNGRVVERGVIEVQGLRIPTLEPAATVIKLDIEGEEFRVIPDQIDELPNVHTWVIEIHPWKTRNPLDLMPLLTSRFDVQWINRAAMSVEPYPDDADWSVHTTVICRR
ncbi:MAG: FkbM family methyltransferase [Burkholderiales bacterium]|nr:FkbM family methyltransferase [Phycisphaerae bacterium]